MKNIFKSKFSLTTKVVAFTLAETLIVMGIIGVVAALTLPNLNNSTNNKEKVVKLKKIYQNLNDALGRAVAVYGPVDEWFASDNDNKAKKIRIGNRMTEFMKLSKNCGATQGCLTSGSGDISNYEFITADGAAVSIQGSLPTSVIIKVDLDGSSKGRNFDGSDVFYFNLISKSNEPNTIEPYGTGAAAITYGSSTLLTSCAGPAGGYDCAAWVINYDNMDYLKLNSNGKCPNGSSLNISANPPVVTCN